MTAESKSNASGLDSDGSALEVTAEDTKQSKGLQHPTGGVPFTVLDVGCNEGDLTTELAAVLHRELTLCAPLLGVENAYGKVAPVVVGIDLDAELIARAQTKWPVRRQRLETQSSESPQRGAPSMNKSPSQVQLLDAAREPSSAVDEADDAALTAAVAVAVPAVHFMVGDVMEQSTLLGMWDLMKELTDGKVGLCVYIA